MNKESFYKLNASHLFHLCRSLPDPSHAEAVAFVIDQLNELHKAEAKNEEDDFLAKYPQLYEFLIRYSNEMCFQAFEKKFGKHKLLVNYLKYHNKKDNKVLHAFILQQDTSLPRRIALEIKEAFNQKSSTDEQKILLDMNTLLCTRAPGGYNISEMTEDQVTTVCGGDVSDGEEDVSEEDSEEAGDAAKPEKPPAAKPD